MLIFSLVSFIHSNKQDVSQDVGPPATLRCPSKNNRRSYVAGDQFVRTVINLIGMSPAGLNFQVSGFAFLPWAENASSDRSPRSFGHVKEHQHTSLTEPMNESCKSVRISRLSLI